MTTHLFDTRTLSTSLNRPTDQSNNRPVNLSTSQSNYQTIKQPLDQPLTSQAINQSNNDSQSIHPTVPATSTTLSMPASTAPKPIDPAGSHSIIQSILEHLKRNRIKYFFGSLTLVTGMAAYLAYRSANQSISQRRRDLQNRSTNQSNETSQDESTLSDFQYHAARCLDAGDLTGAYHCLSDAIDQSIDHSASQPINQSATLYLNRANILYLMGEYQDCLDDANACIRCCQMKPNNHSSNQAVNLYGLALLMKGRALAGLGDYENASHIIDQAIHAEKKLKRTNPSYSGKHGAQKVLDVMQQCLTDTLECLRVKQTRETMTHKLKQSASLDSLDEGKGRSLSDMRVEITKPTTVRSNGMSLNDFAQNSIDKSLSCIHHDSHSSAFAPVHHGQYNHDHASHSHHQPLIDRVLHAIPNPASNAHHRDADDNQALYQPLYQQNGTNHLAAADYLAEPTSPVSPVSPASPSILDAIKAANATAEKKRLRDLARKQRAQSIVHTTTLPDQPVINQREKSRAKSVDSERPVVSITPGQSNDNHSNHGSLNHSVHINGIEYRSREPRLVV